MMRTLPCATLALLLAGCGSFSRSDDPVALGTGLHGHEAGAVRGRGVGYLISFLGDAGAYPAMFGVVLTVAALGFLADRAYLRFMRHALRWRE